VPEFGPDIARYVRNSVALYTMRERAPSMEDVLLHFERRDPLFEVVTFSFSGMEGVVEANQALFIDNLQVCLGVLAFNPLATSAYGYHRSSGYESDLAKLIEQTPAEQRSALRLITAGHSRACEGISGEWHESFEDPTKMVRGEKFDLEIRESDVIQTAGNYQIPAGRCFVRDNRNFPQYGELEVMEVVVIPDVATAFIGGARSVEDKAVLLESISLG